MNILLVLLFVCLLDLPVKADYGGGTGQPDDPYLIYTAEQMNEIGSNPNDWDKHFKLMADIDLGRYQGTDFNIIGESRSNASAASLKAIIRKSQISLTLAKMQHI